MLFTLPLDKPRQPCWYAIVIIGPGISKLFGKEFFLSTSPKDDAERARCIDHHRPGSKNQQCADSHQYDAKLHRMTHKGIRTTLDELMLLV